MKKTLMVIAALFLFGLAPTARAQSLQGGPISCDPTSLTPTCPSTQTCNSSGTCVDGSASLGPITGGASQSASAPDPAAAQTAIDPKGTTDEAYNSVMIWIMTLFAWLLGVAALTLDYTVYYTVVTMGNYVHNLTAVGVTWRIMRDIGNIALIFGFLAIGISIILNTERLGYGKKMLPMLLLAAVFLNFSLFVSEAVIDVGNLFATQFYTQINGGTLPTADSLSKTTTKNEGISTKIMSQLGLQTIYGDATDPVRAKALFQHASPTLIAFMGIFLFMVTAFVMFSLAFILITRFVALIVLIMLAPIGFAGLAVPKLAGKAKQWWDQLFKQTISAPVLLLLLYIALAVITDAHFLTGFGTDSTGSATANATTAWLGFINNANLTGFAGVLLSFFVAMGLLIAVTVFAKDLSAAGAGFAMKWGSKLSGAGLVVGGVGFAGRHTVGLGSKYAAKRLRNTAPGRTFVGRNIADKIEKVGDRSFDVRNTAGAKKLAGYGLDLGTGQKGGYKADFEGRVKSYEKAASGISGKREATTEEIQSINTARVATGAARTVHEAAQREYGDHQAEIARLEEEKKKISENPIEYEGKSADMAAVERKLSSAHGNLSVSEQKVQEAKGAHEKSTGTTRELMKKVEKATSEAGRKATYQDRLANKWGAIPLIGTAAATAAKKHIKEANESGKLDSLIKKMIVDEGIKAGLAKEKEDKTAAPVHKAPSDEH